VPQGFSIVRHCEFLSAQTGAEKFILLPAKRCLPWVSGTCGVRHGTGKQAEELAEVMEVTTTTLNELEGEFWPP